MTGATMRNVNFATALISFVFISGQTSLASDEFPLRADYSDLQFVETEDLSGSYEDFLIIDVRSESEYEVIHMVGANHVPLAREKTFVSSLEKLAGSRDRKIAMYCNGITCAKSYKGTRRALRAGFSNVWVYDAGIMRWGRVHPDKTALLGDSPLDPARLLTSENFSQRKLPLDEFLVRASQRDAIVFDIREAIQRADVPELPGIDSKKVVLTRFTKYIETDRFRQQAANKTVFIFDAVGRQVRWVQYYLEARGIDRYYFLEGGVRSMQTPAKAAH